MLGSVLFAKVTATNDPDNLGRVQVSLPALGTSSRLWLRCLSPFATNDAGVTFLPEVGDEVVVLRGQGDDIEGMIVLGSVFGGANPPPVDNADGTNATKQIRTRSGNQITFSDAAGATSVRIETAQGSVVALSDAPGAAAIQFADASGTVSFTLGPDGAALTVSKGKPLQVDISGDAKVKVQGHLDAKVVGTTTLRGSSTVTLESASELKLESDALIDIRGSAMVSVKAALVKVSGSMIQLN